MEGREGVEGGREGVEDRVGGAEGEQGGGRQGLEEGRMAEGGCCLLSAPLMGTP